jgi:hypothetical protein
MSKGDAIDVQKSYDSFAAYLRDCSVKGDSVGVKHAEARLKELDATIAKAGEMKVDASVL